MHSKNVADYVCFKGSLDGKKLASPFIISRMDKQGIEYIDEIMELPNSLNFSHAESTFAIQPLSLPPAGFRYLK